MAPMLRMLPVAVIALALAGCETPVPQVLGPEHVPSNFSAPTARSATVWPSPRWWSGFNSPDLDTLVATAQKNNLDVAAAAARVMQAEAQADISGAALYPTLSVDGTAQRSRTGAGGVPHARPLTANDFGLSLEASYQLDLWGRARAGLRAADQLVLASTYAQEVVALTVTADVANAYLDILALRQRIAIARHNADAARRILKVVQVRVTNGVSSRLDLAQQEAQLASVEATIPALQEQEREARYTLAILLGRLPEGFDVQGDRLDRIVAPQVAPGLPSELLRRRPDIAEAEANLASAHANLDAARAAFFPQIGLTGSTGFNSATIGSMFGGPAFGWSIGASLLQTIFDGGLLQGQLDLNKDQQQELIATYRSTVLNAFSDVETTLGQVSSLADQEILRTKQADASAEAFKISELQYREGTTDLLNLLTAQETLFTAQDQLVQIKLARLQSDVGLYQALGGGWSEAAEAATQTIPVGTTPVEAGPPATPPPAASGIPATPGPMAIPKPSQDSATRH